MDLNALMKLFPDPINDVFIIFASAVVCYFVYLGAKRKATDVAVADYQAALDAQKELSAAHELQIQKLQKDMESMTLEKREMEKTIHNQIGQIDQLTKMLTYQDPDFRGEIKSILELLQAQQEHTNKIIEHLNVSYEKNSENYTMIKEVKKSVDCIANGKKNPA